MRVILLTDLHIKPESTPESVRWVKHFCSFLRNNCCGQTLVFVLGDVIDQGNKLSFDAADRIFKYIEWELSTVNYQIFFIPGNHDYCEGNILYFTHFCKIHQSKSTQLFDFSIKKTWNISLGEINFILTDTINDSNYSLPGQLDMEGIRECLLPRKRNILLMHHSMVFEDNGTHTGIINQQQSLKVLEECDIQDIFHGHAHASRNYVFNKELRHYGVGSIGLEKNDLEDLVNEQEQFLEASISGKYIEVIKNWIYRGGGEVYASTQIYPETDKQYSDYFFVGLKAYTQPKNYIDRYVLSRELASEGELTRTINIDKKLSLLEVCSKHVRVLLIADAGLGKSVELNNLAYVTSRENPYFIPILISLNIYNGETLQEYINTWAPEYSAVNPEKLLLIMDGYDEIENVTCFKRSLKQYIVGNPNTHICISMRSNFLLGASDVFSDFDTYQLLDLSQSDIVNQLKQNGIDYYEFYGECQKKGLTHLINNPFYFSELINLYHISVKLPMPNEMMERFIEERISKDSVKFEYVISSSLEESKHELEIALTKLAFGMQLLDTSSCSDNQFQTMIKTEDRQLVKYSSLTIKTLRGHEFSHNIFREYLVAKYISSTSKDNIIELISIPGTKFLNHNWFNVLGFVTQLNKDSVLLDWIYETEPLFLTKLEPDRIDLEIRFEIFKKTLTEIINKNIWFRNGMCTEEELATFTQSSHALTLLLDHIASPTHFRSLYFCLAVLSSYTQLFDMDAQVQHTLVDCYQSDDVRAHEKRVAISAIAKLGFCSSVITKDLITRFKASDSSYIRLGVYEYLLITKGVNDNLDFILSGIEYISYSHKESEVSNASEHYKLRECLMSVDSPKAVAKVISWYTCEKNMDMDFYDKVKLFSGIFKEATVQYSNGYTALFDIVYNFFINATKYYSRQHIPDAIKFFSDTRTLESAFLKLVTESTNEKLYIIHDILCEKPELLDLFCRLYAEDKILEPNLFEQYVMRRHIAPTDFQRCADAVRVKTGKVLDPLEPPVDYEKIQRADIQKFFNALFEKEHARVLLKELIGIYENQEITIEELSQEHMIRENYPSGTRQLELAIIQSGMKDVRVADFFELINWDKFFDNRVIYIFNHEERNNQININQEQVTVLYDLYQRIEKDMNLHIAFKELDSTHYSMSSDFYVYMTLKKRLSFSSPESFYLGFLEVPHFFIDKKQPDEKYDLIEQHISRKKIEDRIIELLTKETRVSVLYDLFFGCKKYHLSIEKNIAVRFCANSDISTHERQIALEILCEIFGVDVVLQEVMPVSDEPLFEIIVSTLKDEGGTALKREILERYKKIRSLFLLEKMIYMNMPEGLQIYIVDSKKLGKPVDAGNGINGVTKAISSINDKKLLHLLLSAVRLRFSEGFDDSSFSSLYSSLMNAFKNSSKTEFDTVMREIEKLKEEMSENLDCIGFCNTLQDDILEENKEKLIKKWTIFEVSRVLQTII